MSALFPKPFNTVARVSAALALGVPAVATAVLLLYQRTSYATGQFHPYEQPVEFDHRHHVKDVGIDCRFCHHSVEVAATAGIPPTQLCMGCHGQVWNRSPLLDLVRNAYFTDRPIAWRRVHNLPDFVYFDHSIHVNKGVGCVSCHGRVDDMPSVMQVAELTMGFCLDCHRNPERHIRPKEEITNLAWAPPRGVDPIDLGKKLIQEYDIHPRTSCSTCHR
ncbi:MAG TPA: cytochrome c3 family protein [Myxococcaceae bacterium]|nr:cytochrome c3 family protein [Myxococcaceae bacterium]